MRELGEASDTIAAMSDADADEQGGSPWTSDEIVLIVADYFEMLRLELLSEPFVKSQRNAALQALTGRSRASIEFKHRNISAVLDALGEPWILGYRPASNYQKSLVAGVERQLSARNEIVVAEPARRPGAQGLEEGEAIYFGPPPTRLPRPDLPDHVVRLVRKFDPAERDLRNRALGKMGEQKVFVREQARLRLAGRDDLSRKVRWVSQDDGDGAGFDIRSYDRSGAELLLEVKTTMGGERTPFFISENERRLSEERAEAFRLVRLYDFARTPKGFEITPPLADSVGLSPTQYRATFADQEAPPSG